MAIPLGIGLVDAAGKDMPLKPADGRKLRGNVLVLTQPSERITFTDVAHKPVVSLNRGFSAPIKLTVNYSQDDLSLLAAHDSDPFNRWQALQTIATEYLIANVASGKNGGTPRDPAALITAMRETLESKTLEPAFAGLALALPSVADIARDIGKDIDHDAIFAARQTLRRAIGGALQPRFLEVYGGLASRAPYSPDAASAGRRTFRNACLDYIAVTPEPAAIALAVTQYRDADNMTDRLAALSVLSQHDVPERQQAFDDFYKRFEKDALVIDKWFTIQAMIPDAGTLAHVRSLLTHSAFDISNPNRVRSLVGAFVQSNQTQFNRADGAGYDFLAEIVQQLDSKNPQVSARLMTAFRTWRALEPKRRALAEKALRRVAQTPGLSRDTSDIAERSLAAT
jgi:aminopeptidase N